MKEDSQGKDDEINSIIRVSHPIVSKLKELLGINYNFYIEGLRDMGALLRERGFRSNVDTDDEYSWYREYRLNSELVKEKLNVNKNLFDQDNLKYIKPADWDDNNIKLITKKEEIDELPF